MSIFQLSFDLPTPKTHLVVDVNNLFFRAQNAYAMLDENDPANPVSSVFGPFRLMGALIRQMDGEHEIHFVQDGVPQHRYDLYDGYKKTRREAKEKRKKEGQDPLSEKLWKEFYKTLGLLPAKWYKEEDLEADDTIASLTKQLLADDPTCQVWIMSSDHDLWGLICSRVICVALGSKLVGKTELKKRYGLEDASKIRLYKSFFGDKSDELPKVNRLRTKPMLPYLLKHDTVDGVYEEIQDSSFAGSPLEKEKLLAFKDQAHINFKVATLVIREVQPKHIRLGDENALVDWLNLKECRSLVFDTLLFFPGSFQSKGQ